MAADSRSILTNIYKAELGRDADEEGLNFYMGQLQAGKTADQIRAEINASSEGRAYDTVSDIYRGELGRATDPGGQNYYVSQLVSGNKTAEQIQAEINASEEGRQFDLTGTAGGQTGTTTGGTTGATTGTNTMGAATTANAADVQRIINEAFADIIPTDDPKSSLRSGQLGIRIDSKGLPSTVDIFDKDGYSVGTVAFNAADILRAQEQFGFDLQDLRGLGLQLDALGIGYRPYQLYKGTGSDHGIDFEDLIAGGLGTAYDWRVDPNAAWKGEGAVSQLNSNIELAKRRGITVNPNVTTEQGISYDALRALTNKGGTTPYVVFNGGVAAFYKTMEEAQEAQKLYGGTITDLTPRGAVNTQPYWAYGGLTGNYADQIAQRYATQTPVPKYGLDPRVTPRPGTTTPGGTTPGGTTPGGTTPGGTTPGGVTPGGTTPGGGGTGGIGSFTTTPGAGPSGAPASDYYYTDANGDTYHVKNGVATKVGSSRPPGTSPVGGGGTTNLPGQGVEQDIASGKTPQRIIIGGAPVTVGGGFAGYPYDTTATANRLGLPQEKMREIVSFATTPSNAVAMPQSTQSYQYRQIVNPVNPFIVPPYGSILQGTAGGVDVTPIMPTAPIPPGG